MYLVHRFFPNILPVIRRSNLILEIELPLFKQITSTALKAEPLSAWRGVSVGKPRLIAL